MKLTNYILIKLASAAFTFAVLILLVILNSGFNLFGLQQELENPMYYFFIYGYGILISVLVDLLHRKIEVSIKTRILLYILSCYILFFILSSLEGFEFGAIAFSLIAGTVAAGCSLLFLFGEFLSKKYRWVRISFALIVPALFLLLLKVDVTEKENYKEQTTKSSYEASFTYFNGEHKIPISLNTADKLTFSMEWNIETGGYGYHLEDENGDYIGTISFPDDQLTYTAEKNGTYYITIEGHGAKGQVAVQWEIEKFSVK